MPNRVLKESIRTSPNLNACGVWARDLFTRLLTVADDYGRFEADPNLLRAACYPRLLDQATAEQVETWRDELASPDLPDGPCIRIYEARGRLYGYLPTWFDHQRPARSKSKYPPPPKLVKPPDAVSVPTDDHNAPQSAAIRSDLPTTDSVLRESVVGSRGIEKREAGVVEGSEHGANGHAAEVNYLTEGFGIDPALLRRWTEAYPAVDVAREVQRAHAWAVANPQNRKSNWQRFLVNWLKREQDRQPRPSGSSAPAKTRPAILDLPPLTDEQVAENQRRAKEMVAAAIAGLPRVAP